MNRRDFFRKTSCALTMAALASQARHFGMMSALAQEVEKTEETANSFAGYKALVCIFLSGGNDGNNMVIPVHGDANLSNYTSYSNARSPQGLAFTQAQLQGTNINVPRMGNLAYALHPNFGVVSGESNNGIHELFAQGKLAVVPNVGNLVRPMTKAQYINRSVERPYQLFSHSDQVDQQQTSRADRKIYTGWGGRLADRIHAAQNPGALIPMITSISGMTLYTVGQATTPLTLADSRTALNQTLVLSGFGGDTASAARRTSFNELRNFDRSSNLIKATSDLTSQAVQASQALSSYQDVTTTFPTNSIGYQLKQVARIIKKRSELNVSRQIFYVQLGSFDTHTGQVASATTGQNGLLLQLSQALRAFYDEMTAQGAQNDVTAFTMSDFGRTLNPAGTGAGVVGTDHAWGNHMLVLGGAVRGGDFYGINSSNGTPFPTLTLAGPDDTDTRGRWIPTTSTEQYAATLARWYGLPEADLSIVFPNIGNFTNNDLGFMTL